MAFGALCMVATIACDFLSVLGRHLGLVLFGAVEVARLCMVGIVAAALVLATLHGAHASVQLLVTRLSSPWQRRQDLAARILAFLVLALLFAACAWVGIALWPQSERTGLLGLPVAPARLVWDAALLISAGLALAAVRPERGGE